jgi:two-component system, NtrC family, response regulator AtoC
MIPEPKTDPFQLRILVIDDDQEVRTSLQTVLETLGYATHTAATGEEGLHAIQREPFDLVLCDLRLPGASGLDVLKHKASAVPVILMTAYGNADIATQAARGGAFDYISKPINPDDLIFTLRKFEDFERLKRENETLKASLSERYSFKNIVAQSESFKNVFETIKRLSPFNTTVMITGESGTGKELLARAIHESSPRRGKSFIAINCGAIPENLMESELFGHRKGAFTDASRDKKGLFEEASGGTLFLDEVGELPLHLQVKLLRALQEQTIRRVGDEQSIPIDVRLISATLRNLESDAQAGRFREDLLYRLNVVSVHLPPLRERVEDISLLIEHFLKKHSKRLGIPAKRVGADVMKVLLEYEWRGNARELENCIERALVLSQEDVIGLESLPEQVTRAHTKRQQRASTETNAQDDNLSIKQKTSALEIDLIQRALAKTGGNRTHAAKILEISHRALLYKLKEYGLSGGEASSKEA